MEPKVFYGIRKTTRSATIAEAHEGIEGARNVVNIVVQSNLGLRSQFVLKSCSKTELFENRIIFSHYK